MVLRHLTFKVLPTVNYKVHRKKISNTEQLHRILHGTFYFFSLKKKSLFTENLSRRSTSIISVSSTFELYTANKANDGNLNTTYIDCSHTDLNQTRAWLQVDLGKPYNINHVKIYYRNDGMHILFPLIIPYHI